MNYLDHASTQTAIALRLALALDKPSTLRLLRQDEKMGETIDQRKARIMRECDEIIGKFI